MRQAGRYLPEYRKLREKWSLRDLFFTPELAAEITLLPVDLLHVDAAILFSDITVIAPALGLKLEFKEGPSIEPLGSTHFTRHPEALEPIYQAIRIIKQRSNIPLIGFCGGPFTVASYMIEKHQGQELSKTKRFLYEGKLTPILEAITQVSIDYLRAQVEAGADAIQIFDSWAHVLTQEQWQQYCFPYLKRLIESVSVPVILFMRGASLFVDELVQLKPAAISFDWQRPLKELRKRVPQPLAVQGNLDPDLLYAPLPIIQQTVQNLLRDMENDPGFILNLGHGVKPDVPVEAVRCLIQTAFSQEN